jgi:DNA-binding transcriptional regulator YhcF (GntR family)
VGIRTDQAQYQAPVPPIQESDTKGITSSPTLIGGGHDTSFERLHFILDRAEPLVEQIARQIALFLVGGALQGRLPPADVGARRIPVSKRTMLAVYQLLEEHGMATSSTQVGTRFTDTSPHAARRYLFSDQATALIRKGYTLDLREEEIVGVFLATLERIERQRATAKGTIEPNDAR